MESKDLEYRIVEVERLVKILAENILSKQNEYDVEKGKLMALVAKEITATREELTRVNTSQDDRLALLNDYQELNDDRFQLLGARVKDIDRRQLYLERAIEILKKQAPTAGRDIRDSLADDWEETTDLRMVAQASQRSRQLVQTRSVPPALAVTKPDMPAPQVPSEEEMLAAEAASKAELASARAQPSAKDDLKTVKIIGAIGGLIIALGTAVAGILQAWN